MYIVFRFFVQVFREIMYTSQAVCRQKAAIPYWICLHVAGDGQRYFRTGKKSSLPHTKKGAKAQRVPRQMAIKRYLPCGSVVLLKGGEKRLMIIGIAARNGETGETYDYSAVLYPEGYYDPNKIYLFNNEDVQDVSFTGCHDDEWREFQERFAEAMAAEENE